jgi:molybdopterin converting factor small subunit
VENKFLILIRLLGNCKKVMGLSSLHLEKQSASINEIVSFLERSALESKANFSIDNHLLVVNGVDSSLLDTNELLVQNGDTVTVVPIVHGG